MILHYLKIAFRNLWKYKTHSLISVLCLAVGITFFTVMNLFVSRFTGYRDLPDVERKPPRPDTENRLVNYLKQCLE